MLRFLRLIHAWSGAFLALFIAAIAFSGAFVAMGPEFIRLTVPAAKAPPQPPATYGQALLAVEQARPGALHTVTFAPHRLGVHRVFFMNGDAAFVRGDGTIVQEWGGERRRLEDVALSFHHTFLLGEKGRLLAGLVGLAIIAMAISGLILAWPSLQTFQWRVWPVDLSRRELLASHRNLSIILAAFLLIQAPTGVGMIFDQEIRKLTGSREPAPSRATPRPPNAATDWPRIFRNAQAVYPRARIRKASAPRSADAPYVVQLAQRRDLNPEGSARVFLDWQGQVLGARAPDEASGAQQAQNAFLTIHSGGFNRTFGRYLTALVGLALGVTAAIAALSFVLNLLPKRRRRRA